MISININKNKKTKLLLIDNCLVVYKPCPLICLLYWQQTIKIFLN